MSQDTPKTQALWMEHHDFSNEEEAGNALAEFRELSGKLEKANAQLLYALQSMCYQHCDTRKADKDYNGQVAGSLVTDSEALSANATALQVLAEHGRFRIVAEGGRMVIGYWSENDPVLPDNLDRPADPQR